MKRTLPFKLLFYVTPIASALLTSACLPFNVRLLTPETPSECYGSLRPFRTEFFFTVDTMFATENSDELICIDRRGRVLQGTLKRKSISFKNRKRAAFPKPLRKYGYDGTNRVVFGWQGSECHFIDLKSGRYQKKQIPKQLKFDRIKWIVSVPDKAGTYCINMLRLAFDLKKNHASLYRYEPSSDSLTLINDSFFSATLHPLGPAGFLFREHRWPGHDRWHVLAGDLVTLHSASLTDTLNALEITAVYRPPAPGIKNKLISIRKDARRRDVFTFTFDSPDENVIVDSVNPETLLYRAMGGEILLSPEGEWIVSNEETDRCIEKDSGIVAIFMGVPGPRLITFQRLYRGGFDLILKAWHRHSGYPTSARPRGCFVSTSEWGLVYVDILKGKRTVFKMYPLGESEELAR